jgi:hypothetical protein
MILLSETGDGRHTNRSVAIDFEVKKVDLVAFTPADDDPRHSRIMARAALGSGSLDVCSWHAAEGDGSALKLAFSCEWRNFSVCSAAYDGRRLFAT